jgi:hypothetical protein
MKLIPLKLNLKLNLKPKQYKGLVCLNCEQPLNGNENFCSYCGQKNTTKKLSFSVFLNNLFSGFFSYDSRFWKTFIPLLIKPGKVSRQYIEGKRSRFVNPFRLYLNVSIIFFLILGISTKVNEPNIPNGILTINEDAKDSILNSDPQKIDSLFNNVQNQLIESIENDSIKKNTEKDIKTAIDIFKNQIKKSNEKDSTSLKVTNNTIHFGEKLDEFRSFQKEHPNYSNERALDSMGYTKTIWNKFYYQTTANITTNIKETESKSGRKKLIKKITSYISISLFIFLPVFTLFLMLIYIRRKFTYMEHLVFVFHTQTVFFLLFTILYLIDIFVKLENVTWVFLIVFLIYLYKGLRHFYGQGRIKTIIKFILLNSYYMFLATFGFIVVAIISFMIT